MSRNYKNSMKTILKRNKWYSREKNIWKQKRIILLLQIFYRHYLLFLGNIAVILHYRVLFCLSRSLRLTFNLKHQLPYTCLYACPLHLVRLVGLRRLHITHITIQHKKTHVSIHSLLSHSSAELRPLMRQYCHDFPLYSRWTFIDRTVSFASGLRSLTSQHCLDPRCHLRLTICCDTYMILNANRNMTGLVRVLVDKIVVMDSVKGSNI